MNKAGAGPVIELIEISRARRRAGGSRRAAAKLKDSTMWRAQSTWVRIVINTTGQPLTPPSFSSRGVVKQRGTGSAKLRFGSLWKAFHSVESPEGISPPGA